jgi:hypothetical protein
MIFLVVVVGLIVVILLFLLRPRKGLFPGPTQFGVLQCLPQTLWNMFPKRHKWYIEMQRKYGDVVDISYGTGAPQNQQITFTTATVFGFLTFL